MAHTPPAGAWSLIVRAPETGNPNWPGVIVSTELEGMDPLASQNVVAVVNAGHIARGNIIACAPDLLAALKGLYDYLGPEWEHAWPLDRCPIMDAARAAIARAEGE